MESRKQFIIDWLNKPVHIVVDRPIGFQHGSLNYPINYGYIPGLLAGDGEEQDVYILGIDDPVTHFDGQVIGAVFRQDDCEDKLIAAPVGQIFHQGEIAAAVRFQEQFFDSRVISCFEKSCGVLPYRMQNGKKEFLLVFETFSKCWSLPKGHMEAFESEEETALRELYEETGLTATLELGRSAYIEYPISSYGRKRVVFYLGEVCGEPKTRAGEIENFKWVTEEQLKEYLFPDTVQACYALLR